MVGRTWSKGMRKRVISITVDEDVYNDLRKLPNMSGWINEVVKRNLVDDGEDIDEMVKRVAIERFERNLQKQLEDFKAKGISPEMIKEIKKELGAENV